MAWFAAAGAGAALVLVERGLLPTSREAGGAIDRSLKSFLYVALTLFSDGRGSPDHGFRLGGRARPAGPQQVPAAS